MLCALCLSVLGRAGMLRRRLLAGQVGWDMKARAGKKHVVLVRPGRACLLLAYVG